MENCFYSFGSALLYKHRARSEADLGGWETIYCFALHKKPCQGNAVTSGNVYPLSLPVAMLLQVVCSPIGLPRLSSHEEACQCAPNPTIIDPSDMQTVRDQHLTVLG